MIAFSWDQRIHRAEQLAEQQPASKEFLTFYARLAQFQKGVYESLKLETGDLSTTLLDPYIAPLLERIREIGPPAAAEQATRLEETNISIDDLLADHDDFFGRALLQPYMECLVSRNSIPVETVSNVCPYCGDPPQAAVLRGAGDGAKRSLLCSLCSSEWGFRRLLCPACGEERDDRLPVYTAAEISHVRVEACDTCRTYIKAVDLSRDGLAVPCVDEIAAVSLDLWAEENGYRKIKRNLLGL